MDLGATVLPKRALSSYLPDFWTRAKKSTCAVLVNMQDSESNAFFSMFSIRDLYMQKHDFK